MKRNTGYDLIRIISIFLVVASHANVAYLGANQGKAGWFFVVVCTAICSVSVPLFFMVSGALLLDADRVITLRELFLKRIPKQAVPFAVWSLIYVIARIVMGKIPFSLSAFTSLIHEPAYYQFWFMYALFAIYLLLPALQAVVLRLERRHLEYLIALWLVFSLFIPTLQVLVPGFNISEHVDLILCEGYVGYFLLGYYLKKYHAKASPRAAGIFGVSGVALAALVSVAEYFISAERGAKYEGYFNMAYLTPFVAVAAAGIFVSLQNLSFKKDGTLCKSLKLGSELAIGVFYVHMLVMAVLEHIGLLADTSVVLLICKTAVSYIASLAIAFVISRIPYVRKILMGLK